jgi:hypothetical protein
MMQYDFYARGDRHCNDCTQGIETDEADGCEDDEHGGRAPVWNKIGNCHGASPKVEIGHVQHPERQRSHATQADFDERDRAEDPGKLALDIPSNPHEFAPCGKGTTSLGNFSSRTISVDQQKEGKEQHYGDRRRAAQDFQSKQQFPHGHEKQVKEGCQHGGVGNGLPSFLQQKGARRRKIVQTRVMPAFSPSGRQVRDLETLCLPQRWFSGFLRRMLPLRHSFVSDRSKIRLSRKGLQQFENSAKHG